MDRRSEELLELPAIRERLAGMTSFPAGRELALAIMPSPEADEVAHRCEETEEAGRLRQAGLPSPQGAFDVREGARAAERGGVLDAAVLAEVLATCRTALDVRAGVLAQREEAPLLAERTEGIDEAVLRGLVGELGRALDERGGLRDDASPELARLRRSLVVARAQAAERMRDLARLLRVHLQEGYVTERAGRPVLAVKATSSSAVPGLVHDRSASGQTIFVEPLASVEDTNRARELEAAERDEAERILGQLSAAVGRDAASLAFAVAALADVDVALARARLSTRWDGCRVEVGGEIELRGARHPLLDPEGAVPIDLVLGPVRALVVSGPNTGGKTVALKTLGLLALLHQCGLRLPARRARLPVFDAVLADIGDEQSIAASLSTFSGHVRSLVRILEAAADRSLVLLDEVAAGTDPAEGAALARAILERLVEQGAVVVATTHHDALKAWASAAAVAENASMGVDGRTLAPTYEVRLGEPGASYALTVAERLGLPASVVAAARATVAPERLTLEGLLADASAARVGAEAERAAARAERDEAARIRSAVAAQERSLEESIAAVRRGAAEERERARAAAERELAEVRREIAALRREVAAARRAERDRRRGVADEERERDRRLGGASAGLRRAEELLAQPGRNGEPHRQLEIGQAVRDPALGMRGRLVRIEGDTAEVQGSGARLRVPLERLVPDERDQRPPAPTPERRPPLVAVTPEIDVRGQRAEAARAAVRERVDAVAMAGLPSLRVIHGKGTGALRAAVREELARHPLAGTVAEAPQNEGGDGVTIVTFA